VTRSKRLKLVVQLRRFQVLEATRRHNLAGLTKGYSQDPSDYYIPNNRPECALAFQRS